MFTWTLYAPEITGTADLAGRHTRPTTYILCSESECFPESVLLLAQ